MYCTSEVLRPAAQEHCHNVECVHVPVELAGLCLKKVTAELDTLDWVFNFSSERMNAK